MKYFCIGDEDTVTGFRLAGVQGRAVATTAETREAFLSVTAMPQVGMVIITERLAASIREDVDKFLSASDFPFVLEIPDRNGPAPGRKNMMNVVQQAVGIKL
jgi:V/A-type H+-transporting ATPase subunit F